MSTEYTLHARDLCKRYGETTALADVTLELQPGRLVGLVGENGAGKSTLLNILSGLMQPDSGSVSLPGRADGLKSYAEATRLGVSRVFQEQSLIGVLPVYENVLIGTEARFARAGQILNRRAMIELAQNIMDDAGAGIDVRQSTDALSFSKRQLLEIVRACLGPVRLHGIEGSIVLLDEPTASLDRGDEEIFLSLIERCRQQSSLLFVSHRLGEVLSLSDDIIVMKDGRHVAKVDPRDVDERTLHRLMVGRERDQDYYHEHRQQTDAAQTPALTARNLSYADAYSDVSLDVKAGEVLGIGGLLESGKSELGKGLAGVVPPNLGELRLGDGDWHVPSIGAQIKRGVGYVPAERLVEGMIAEQPLSWNLAMPSGDIFSTLSGMWRHRHEASVSDEMIGKVGIKAQGAGMSCNTLSGGNQQKVVLGRWLARDLSVLILDNPTRGVDAGAKAEIYGLIRDLTDQGVAIVVISDELLELIGLSNRIAIMQHGQIAEMLEAPTDNKPSEQRLVEAMLKGPKPKLRVAA